MEHEGARELTADEAFELFTHPYRRRLLMTLLDHNPEDEAKIPEDLTTNDEELQEMLVGMTHTHLPRLEALDIIEWDREKNVVTRGRAFEELEPLLTLVDDHRDELPDGWL